MVADGIITEETAAAFFRNAESLMAQLNTEGKELAVEYMEYLVSTGKYPAQDNKEMGHSPMYNSLFLT